MVDILALELSIQIGSCTMDLRIDSSSQAGLERLPRAAPATSIAPKQDHVHMET